MMKKPIALIILDGYGLAAKGNCNAVCQASTPVMDRLMAECPWQPIRCSGLDVGLPDGQMGNSEVGHTNIGAGPRGLSGTDPDHKGDPGRHLL